VEDMLTPFPRASAVTSLMGPPARPAERSDAAPWADAAASR
jgi:hypothetical protein